MDTRGTVFRLLAGAGHFFFPHNVRNGPRAHRGGVFPRSGCEADHVPACQRMRGVTPPLLDIASCLIEYVDDFTVHWLEFGW